MQSRQKRLARIPEYWIIDARGKELCFDVPRLTKSEYHSTPLSGAGRVSAVFNRSFVLERERNRVGRYRYRLLAY